MFDRGVDRFPASVPEECWHCDSAYSTARRGYFLHPLSVVGLMHVDASTPHHQGGQVMIPYVNL